MASGQHGRVHEAGIHETSYNVYFTTLYNIDEWSRNTPIAGEFACILPIGDYMTYCD